MTGADSDFEIRLLRDGDSAIELTQLLHAAYARLAAMGLQYKATDQSPEVTLERAAEGECYVGLLDGRIVATVLFRDPPSTTHCPWYDRPDVASFGQFAVCPALQGRGYGRQLMNFVEARAREVGAAELALDTAEPATHLVEWYGRLGYRFVEYAQWGHTNYRTVIMSKRLV